MIEVVGGKRVRIRLATPQILVYEHAALSARRLGSFAPVQMIRDHRCSPTRRSDCGWPSLRRPAPREHAGLAQSRDPACRCAGSIQQAPVRHVADLATENPQWRRLHCAVSPRPPGRSRALARPPRLRCGRFRRSDPPDFQSPSQDNRGPAQRHDPGQARGRERRARAATTGGPDRHRTSGWRPAGGRKPGHKPRRNGLSRGRGCSRRRGGELRGRAVRPVLTPPRRRDLLQVWRTFSVKPLRRRPDG